ncbi:MULTISPECIES: hypothetical protein [Methylobacillus]|uniref:Uncharacterized protein n=1 Tax=Methylobacillus flagellatus (strain ATCC 51484 / DSM 6875 / VKM B-1610 / KT) TaxID=265072 RepID=Q1H3K3_METFK|nr:MULTISPECIES: hypothetical protein [Methylobacillus]ABE48934.1 hypothetical protein Mfla_0664 [Methylobacillus flagellatus KT]MPS49564.1 hypothetical protein [Methylobacillus sp.]
MASIDTKREKLKQKISALTEQLEALEKQSVELNRQSEGMPELIAAFDAVVKTHKVSALEVFEVLLKAKRTGMTLVKKT